MLYKLNLGIENIEKIKQQELEKDFIKFFPISKISYYYPYINLFTYSNPKFKYHNNKFKLIKIIKYLFAFNLHNRIIEGIISSKDSYYKKKIFIKETPILSLSEFEIIEDKDKIKNIPDNIFEIYENLNTLENPCFIDSFCSYLCSKLVEKKITPNLPYFYGNYITIFKTFSYDITDELDQYENDNNYDIRSYNSLNIIKKSNVPVSLIAMEKLDICLADNIENIPKEQWPSIIFQFIFTIYLLQHFFNLVLGDQHIGNIMMKLTSKKYLYYKLDNNFYKIPIYGQILKLIDFNRSTLKIKDIKIYNNIFKQGSDAFEMYFQPINKFKKKKNILPNKSTDLAIFASSILQEKTKMDKKLKKKLKKWCTYKNTLLYKKYKNFEQYKKLVRYITHIDPKNELNSNIFKQFLINKKNIPKKTLIYGI